MHIINITLLLLTSQYYITINCDNVITIAHEVSAVRERRKEATMNSIIDLTLAFLRENL